MQCVQLLENKFLTKLTSKLRREATPIKEKNELSSAL